MRAATTSAQAATCTSVYSGFVVAAATSLGVSMRAIRALLCEASSTQATAEIDLIGKKLEGSRQDIRGGPGTVSGCEKHSTLSKRVLRQRWHSHWTTAHAHSGAAALSLDYHTRTLVGPPRSLSKQALPQHSWITPPENWMLHFGG